MWESFSFKEKNVGGVGFGDPGFDGVLTILGSNGGNAPLGAWGTKFVWVLFIDFGRIPALMLTVTGYSGIIFKFVKLYELSFLLSVKYLEILLADKVFCLR